MVKWTVSHPVDGRQRVTDPKTIEAMRNVPRHLFVEGESPGSAHADHPLPIGYGQTISQPYIVALMTEALRLRPGAKVLEIGTGSGYQAAVLSELTPNVFTIEIVKPLAERAAARFAKLGYKTIRSKQGDGYFGWPEHAP
ncbi:MAG: protein-L-isoaspartate O-methyltransferase, partial [Phycisphaerae bacterium]|nr:protein-L-isoaspartate O-methyltransferase [Phycisphaerae bacterium]